MADESVDMKHEFCDHCPGCRPALIDLTTGGVLSNDSAIMRHVNRVWDNDTTYAERKAFIAVTVHKSRVPADMQLAQSVMVKLTHRKA